MLQSRETKELPLSLLRVCLISRVCKKHSWFPADGQSVTYALEIELELGSWLLQPQKVLMTNQAATQAKWRPG